MERLTVKWTDKVYDTLDPVDILDNEYSKTNYNKLLTKLGEYEDLEDKLNGVSVKQVVDGFIKTVENQTNEEYERGRILTNAEADKWNEYKQLDEQGLLLRLPCKIGSPLYRVYKKPTKCTAYGEYKDDYACQGCEKECDSSYVWAIYKYKADIKTIVCLSDELGKTVFLTQAEAEQRLKEMESD